MNAYVHYELTRRWARDEGFSAQEAEDIAAADVGVDRDHPGDLLHLGNWSYHYRLFGADRAAERGVEEAEATGSLTQLGVALHRAQDAIAHGWLALASHALDPKVDIWEHRSAGTREAIELRSRGLLRRVARAMGRHSESPG